MVGYNGLIATNREHAQADISVVGPTVARSIVRALIKSIPLAGAGLDEIAFGIQDSISNQELRKLVEEILRLCQDHRDNLAVGLSDQIAKELLGRPEIKKLIEKLDTQKDEARLAVSALLVKLDQQTRVAEKIAIDMKKSFTMIESRFDSLISEIRQNHSSFQQKYEYTLRSLEAFRKKSFSDSRADLTLRELRQRLLNQDSRAVSLTAQCLGDALSNPGLKNCIVTLDFTEIYRYAHSPFSINPLSAFSVYLLTASDLNLFMLPSSVSEMSTYFQSAYNKYIDPASVRERIIDKLSHLFDSKRKAGTASSKHPFYAFEDVVTAFGHDQSPIKRMRRLLKKRLQKFDKPLPEAKDVQGHYTVVTKALSKAYPHQSTVARHIDAWNLALIGFFNSTAEAHDQRLIHVSGARSILHVQEFLKREYRDEFGLQNGPLVVHPCSLAYLNCIQHNKVPRLQLNLLTDGALLDYRQFWAMAIDSPSGLTLQQAKDTLSRILYVLEGLGPIVYPCHRQVFDAELRDLVGCTSTVGCTLWERDFDQSYKDIIEVIVGLQDYIEPAAKAMEPFMELARSLDSKNNVAED
jgi:hypothetical protein